MLHSLDHVLVAVEDLEAATRSYASLLGRRPSWRGEHPAAGSANTLFRLDDTYLELLAPAGEGELGEVLRGWLDARGEGPLGLAFGTDDADACRKAWTERGLRPAEVESGLGRDVDSGAFREWRRVPLPGRSTRGVLLFGIEHTSPAEILPPAPPGGPEASLVFGLDHAVIRTADAEACAAVYGEAGLGLRLALDRSFPQWGARLLFFRVGGITVEIAAALGPGDGDGAAGDLADDTRTTPERDHFWGLSWRVRDADAAHARLLEAGFDPSPVREGRRPGTRVLTVRGETHGVATLFLEPPG